MGKKRVFIFSICILMASGGIFSGCSSKTENPPQTFESPQTVDGTVHIENIGETTIPLVREGVSEYKIVYPAEDSSNPRIRLAAKELRDLFFEATGAELPIVTDEEYTSDSKILSLGTTGQFEEEDALSAKMSAYNLGQGGYIVQTLDDSVYMNGRTDDSVVYSVYNFLKHQFGFEAYYIDSYKIDSNIDNCNLLSFDVVDIPDFQSRTIMNADVFQDETYRYRMRASSGESEMFSTALGIPWCHNWFSYLPKEEYQADHADWYSTTGTQLCLSRDPDGIAEAVAEKMIAQLKESPEKEAVTFSLMDGGGWCNCPECTKEQNLYDQPSAYMAASYIRVTNKIAEIIARYNETECPEKDIVVYWFAYDPVRYVPVKVDENKQPVLDAEGNYQPYSEELTMAENVGVVFLPGGSGFYSKLEDSESGRNVMERVRRLSAISESPHIYIYTYGTQFDNYMMPFNVLEYRQDYYQFFKKEGAVAFYEQAQYNTPAAADWGPLKSYISAKLMWNVNEDVEALIRDFFANYFGVASDVMYDMYNEYRVYMRYLAEEKGLTGGVLEGNTQKSAEYWPYDRVQRFLGFIDEAYARIEPLQYTDRETYDILYDHILKESLSYRYIKLELYANYMEYSLYTSEKEQFINDCIRLHVMRISEHGEITGY